MIIVVCKNEGDDLLTHIDRLFNQLDSWKELNYKQRKMLSLYLQCGEMKRSYRKAYKSKLTGASLREMASRRFKEPKVVKALQEVYIMTDIEAHKRELKYLSDEQRQDIATAKDPIEKAAETRAWLANKLKCLINFSLKAFTKIDEEGKPYFDFTEATDDDWWCIGELGITVKSIDKVPYREYKLKPESKLKAIEMLAKFNDVQAIDTGVSIQIQIEDQRVTREAIERKYANGDDAIRVNISNYERPQKVIEQPLEIIPDKPIKPEPTLEDWI